MKKRLPNIWGIDEYLSFMATHVMQPGMSKKRARQHLNRMEKKELYNDAVEEEKQSLTRLLDLVYAQCDHIQWEKKVSFYHVIKHILSI